MKGAMRVPPLTMLLKCREARYGQILAKYADDPKTLFIISSDFCHWGTRFNYTFTDKSKVAQSQCALP